MDADPGISRAAVIVRAIAIALGLALTAFMSWLVHAMLVSPIDGPRAVEISLRCFGAFMFGSLALAGLWPIVDAVRVPAMLRRVGPRCPACGEAADVVSGETRCGECGYAIVRQTSRWRFESPDRFVYLVAGGISLAVLSLGAFMLAGAFEHGGSGTLVASILLAALMIPVGIGMAAVFVSALRTTIGKPRRFVFGDSWTNEWGSANAWAEVDLARGRAHVKGGVRAAVALPRALVESDDRVRSDFERGLASALAAWHAKGSARLEAYRTIEWDSVDLRPREGRDAVSIPVAYRVADEPDASREPVERTDRTVWMLSLAPDRTLRKLLLETVTFDWPPTPLVEGVQVIEPDEDGEEDIFAFEDMRLDLNAIIGAIESIGDLRRALEALGRRSPRGGAEVALAEHAVAASR